MARLDEKVRRTTAVNAHTYEDLDLETITLEFRDQLPVCNFGAHAPTVRAAPAATCVGSA